MSIIFTCPWLFSFDDSGLHRTTTRTLSSLRVILFLFVYLSIFSLLKVHTRRCRCILRGDVILSFGGTMAHLCGERTFIIQRFSFVVILERTDLEPFFNFCQTFILKSGRVLFLREGLLSDAETKDPNGP